ncbi:MAG: beta-lactamase family protein [Balneolales bacterium]|nr:beta-lactamase family protein [Balneolales bacterium]
MNKYIVRNTLLLSTLFLVFFAGCDLYTKTTEAEIELTPDRVATLQTKIDSTLNADKVPGAAIMVRLVNGEVFQYGAGYANLETRRSMKINDRFRIGSITKTFVATVILQLVDEGRLELSQTVSQLLPDVELRMADQINVRDLLRHTSGIPNYTGDVEFLLNMFQNPDSYLSEKQLIAFAERHPRYFDPSSTDSQGDLRWGYSNTNYILLGMVIQKITGNTVEQEIHNRIIVPLGMKNTYYATSMYTPDDLVRGYMDIQTSDYAGSGIPGDGQPFYDITNLHPLYAGAAGAMVSSAPDLLEYAEAFITGKFYSNNILQERNNYVTSQFASAVGNYGLGIAKVGDEWIGHKGGISGYELSMYRKEGVATVIVLSNKSPNGRDPSGALLPDAGPALFNTVVGYLFMEPYTYAKPILD